jgi:TPR repeat protein
VIVPDALLTQYRHAWGIEANQEQAVHYLSMAASNSAEVEKLALGAGMKKGGSAKGELVLAMYELANCFRNGWGIKKDPAAAKQYYETAANLGDTDAMNEVAWCYTEGFGTKKDKVRFVSTCVVIVAVRPSPLSTECTSVTPVDVC